MRIISFNCRGLGGLEKGGHLREIITKERINMIKENKMSCGT